MISSVQSQALSFGVSNPHALSARESYDKKIEANDKIAASAKPFNAATNSAPVVPISLQGNTGNNLDIIA